MGSGGQNVKSTAEHKAKGNFRPSRHANRAEHAAKVVETIPKPPDNFDKRHKDKWSEVCGRVFDLGALTESDLDALALYVKQWFVASDAWDDIQSGGITLTSDKGHVYANPAVKIYNEASEKVLKIGDKFGFTPKSRMGLKVEPKAPEDPMAAFLNN